MVTSTVPLQALAAMLYGTLADCCVAGCGTWGQATSSPQLIINTYLQGSCSFHVVLASQIIGAGKLLARAQHSGTAVPGTAKAGGLCSCSHAVHAWPPLHRHCHRRLQGQAGCWSAPDSMHGMASRFVHSGPVPAPSQPEAGRAGPDHPGHGFPTPLAARIGATQLQNSKDLNLTKFGPEILATLAWSRHHTASCQDTPGPREQIVKCFYAALRTTALGPAQDRLQPPPAPPHLLPWLEGATRRGPDLAALRTGSRT